MVKAYETRQKLKEAYEALWIASKMNAVTFTKGYEGVGGYKLGKMF